MLMVCEQAIKKLGLNRDTTRVIVQGFGNVGSNAARLMAQAGYKIIGILEVGVASTKKTGSTSKPVGNSASTMAPFTASRAPRSTIRPNCCLSIAKS